MPLLAARLVACCLLVSMLRFGIQQRDAAALYTPLRLLLLWGFLLWIYGGSS
jgi:hypothetical protein